MKVIAICSHQFQLNCKVFRVYLYFIKKNIQIYNRESRAWHCSVTHIFIVGVHATHTSFHSVFFPSSNVHVSYTGNLLFPSLGKTEQGKLRERWLTGT